MFKQILSIGIVIGGALLGKAAFTVLDQSKSPVAYAVDLFGNHEISTSEHTYDWEPNFGDGTMSYRRTLLFENKKIYLYITTYLSSEPDSELVRYGRSLVKPGERAHDQDLGRSVVIDSSADVRPRLVHISRIGGPEKLAVIYWYEVGGKPTESRNLAKLYSITNLFRRRQDSTAVVLAAECDIDCEISDRRLEELSIAIFRDPDGHYRSVVRETTGQE